jgi:hypothetical protein
MPFQTRHCNTGQALMHPDLGQTICIFNHVHNFSEPSKPLALHNRSQEVVRLFVVVRLSDYANMFTLD